MKDGEIYLVSQKNLEVNLDFSFSFCRKLPRLALSLSYFNFLCQQGGLLYSTSTLRKKYHVHPCSISASQLLNTIFLSFLIGFIFEEKFVFKFWSLIFFILRKKVAPACATLFPILFYKILDKWKQNCWWKNGI